MGNGLRSAVVALIVTVAGTGPRAEQRGTALGSSGQVTGTIVGRIVDAATDQPVGGAEVTVTAGPPARSVAAGPPSNPFAGGPPALRLLTGPDGRFVARDVPAGNAQVRVVAPGYLSGSSGQTRPGGPSRPIPITPEDRIVQATVRLWKHAVISGVITDDGNAPAVNVMVQAMRRTFSSGLLRYVASRPGRTDDRGVYRISGLTPGDYVIVVPQTQTTMPVSSMNTIIDSVMGGEGISSGLMELAAGGVIPTGGAGVQVGDQLVSAASGALPVVSGDGRMAAYLTQYYPAAATAQEAAVVSLASGDHRSGIDIRMPLVATAGIRGTVVGPGGPMANVPVRVVPAAESGGSEALADVARGVTAADGTFQVFGVPVGAYVLRVLRMPRAELPATMASNPQVLALMGGRGSGPARASDRLTLFADVPVSVQGDITDLVVALSPGATLSGRVEFAGTAARVPMTGLTVRLTAQSEQPGRVTLTRVGEDGRFVTAGHVPGRYLLNATGRTTGWFLKSATVNGINAVEQPFDLFSEDIGNVVVTFIDRQTMLSGKVTGANGAPAEGTVLVFPAAHREWIAQGMVTLLMRTVRTQSTGEFSIVGLPARDYLAVALADADVPDPQDPAAYAALARVATPIILAEGAPRTVSLQLAKVAR